MNFKVDLDDIDTEGTINKDCYISKEALIIPVFNLGYYNEKDKKLIFYNFAIIFCYGNIKIADSISDFSPQYYKNSSSIILHNYPSENNGREIFISAKETEIIKLDITLEQNNYFKTEQHKDFEKKMNDISGLKALKILLVPNKMTVQEFLDLSRFIC